MRNRRQFCGQLAEIAGLSLFPGELFQSANLPQRPNIAVFLIDNLGWGDLGCYGGTFHETPNIDQFARESVKFTKTYAGAPVCSSIRATVLTAGKEFLDAHILHLGLEYYVKLRIAKT